MREEFNNLITHISEHSDGQRIYLSGKAIIPEYNHYELPEYNSITIYMDKSVKLCHIVDEWLYLNGLYTQSERREVVDNIYAYKVNDLWIMIDQDMIITDKYQYIYAPFIYMLRPEYVVNSIAISATTGQFLNTEIVDLCSILLFQDLNANLLYQVASNLREFDTKVIQQIQNDDWAHFDQQINCDPGMVYDIITKFLSAFKAGSSPTYTQWSTAALSWT